MKSTSNEERTPPAAVASQEGSQQAGEIRNRWWWIEHSMWTERMLRRLETSEPKTKWFRLWDKVTDVRHLRSAFASVWRNKGAPGVDGQTVKRFEAHVEKELSKLSDELKKKSYRRQPARRAWIAKTGSQEKRPLGIPSVRDRVVEACLRKMIEPIFERDFAEHSYGFRPGRSCQQAVGRVEELLDQGHVHVVDCDLKSYFDTIPQDRLMELIKERVADGNILRLLERGLKAGVLEEMRKWQPSDEGVPQGGVISPLLANIYLNPLDHEMARRGWQMIRYADDFVVMCPSEEAAQEALEYLREWTQGAGLTLHPSKTKIVDAREQGFEFLGWEFRSHTKWPRKKSVQKLRESLRPLSRRTNGRCMGAIVSMVNPKLRGWRAYFKDSNPSSLRAQDGWLRRRLRAMLRKRQKRPGFGRTKADHTKWPNRWFAKQGLYSLEYGSCEYP